MPQNARAGFRAVLEVLVEHRVEFIVVGGVAAVLHGAPVVTFDLDVLHRRSSENVERLLAALKSIRARYRDPRELAPSEEHLRGPGHQLLATTLGPVDVLGSLLDGVTFDDLVDRSVEVDLDGVRVRVLDLPTLLDQKVRLGRAKDLAAIQILRRLLEDERRSPE